MAYKRYIEAVGLAEVIENLDIRVAGKPARWNDAKYSVLREISQAPDADVEEVVRCKECKHGHWNQETCHGKCVHYCDLTDLQINKDHFCSYGERRET